MPKSRVEWRVFGLRNCHYIFKRQITKKMVQGRATVTIADWQEVYMIY